MVDDPMEYTGRNVSRHRPIGPVLQKVDSVPTSSGNEEPKDQRTKEARGLDHPAQVTIFRPPVSMFPHVRHKKKSRRDILERNLT